VGYRTFDQFSHELLRNVNEPIERATIYDARQAINDSYREICQFADWQFLLDRLDLPMFPAYTTGTVTATVGSTTVTGVGTAWQTSWFGQKIILTGDQSEKEILQFNSPTQLTLRYPYNGSSTTIANVGYTIYQDTYPLNIGAGRDLMVLNPSQQWARLLKMDVYTFNNRTAYNRFQTAIGPSVYTDAGADWNTLSPTYRQPRLQFWPKPTALQEMVVQYFRNVTPLAAVTDTTVLPPEFDEILLRLGTYRLKRRYQIAGWSEDHTIAMQMLLQFREKNASQTAMDFQPNATLFPFNDPWAMDMNLEAWPGVIR
jgi:hypothetical protein